MSRLSRSLSSPLMAVLATAALTLSGCGLGAVSGGVYEAPLPGGADVGEDPITLSAEFSDVLLSEQGGLLQSRRGAGGERGVVPDHQRHPRTAAVLGQPDLGDPAHRDVVDLDAGLGNQVEYVAELGAERDRVLPHVGAAGQRGLVDTAADRAQAAAGEGQGGCSQ